MTEPVNPYASPQTDADADSASEPMPHVGADLRFVYIGLSLVYWGIILSILGMMAMVVMVVTRGKETSFDAGFIVGLLGLAVVGIGALMSFVGQCFCIASPGESGARPWVIASIVLQFLNPAMAVALELLGLPMLTGIAGSVIGFLSVGAFVMAMQRLAEYINSLAIRIQAQRVLVMGVILFATLVGGSLLVMGSVGGMFAAVFGIAMLLGAIITFVMYVNLINSLRKAVKPNTKPAVQTGKF